MKTETIEAASMDIEMNALGAIINSNENAKIGLKKLNEADFFEKKHKAIFKAIQEVFNEKNAVDFPLIHHKLNLEGCLNEIGGRSYLIELAETAVTATSSHIEAYCDTLKHLTLKRQLISLSNSLVNDINQSADSWKVVNKLKDHLEQIEKQKHKADSSFSFLLEKNSEESLIGELKEISEGISIGFTIGETDIVIPGGAITIVAAPTSHGKTATLINFSVGALKRHHNKNVYFFTYEENASSILCLFLNTWMGKELSKNNRESIKSHFRNGNVDHIRADARSDFLKDKKAFFDNLIDSGRLRVLYSDMPVEELILAIKFIKANDPNVGMVCIDYMQFLKLLRRTQGSRQEELKEICLNLKDCAVETGLPILLAAQFNRTVVAEGDLSPTNIGEAGDIERAANTIIGMWNRNFDGFSRQGNTGKDGKKINREPAIYFELMKSRGLAPGQSSVMDFNGNSGKLENRINGLKTTTQPIGHNY